MAIFNSVCTPVCEKIKLLRFSIFICASADSFKLVMEIDSALRKMKSLRMGGYHDATFSSVQSFLLKHLGSEMVLYLHH